MHSHGESQTHWPEWQKPDHDAAPHGLQNQAHGAGKRIGRCLRLGAGGRGISGAAGRSHEEPSEECGPLDYSEVAGAA